MDAAAARDGGEAAAWACSAVHLDYDRIRWLSLDATRDELLRAPAIDCVRVLGVRALFSADELEAMTGEMLFAAAVDRGMVDATDLVDAELGDVSVDGERARATYLSRAHGAGPAFTFVREGGRWKVDITWLFGASQAAYETIVADAARDKGLSKPDMLVRLVADSTGRDVNEHLFAPLRRR